MDSGGVCVATTFQPLLVTLCADSWDTRTYCAAIIYLCKMTQFQLLILFHKINMLSNI